jgi:hypothetical protein
MRGNGVGDDSLRPQSREGRKDFVCWSDSKTPILVLTAAPTPNPSRPLRLCGLSEKSAMPLFSLDTARIEPLTA